MPDPGVGNVLSSRVLKRPPSLPLTRGYSSFTDEVASPEMERAGTLFRPRRQTRRHPHSESRDREMSFTTLSNGLCHRLPGSEFRFCSESTVDTVPALHPRPVTSPHLSECGVPINVVPTYTPSFPVAVGRAEPLRGYPRSRCPGQRRPPRQARCSPRTGRTGELERSVRTSEGCVDSLGPDLCPPQ